MAEQRPLDAFVGEGETAPRDVEPKPSTYKWVADGARCTRCDSVDQRFWREEDALVCPSCKEW